MNGVNLLDAAADSGREAMRQKRQLELRQYTYQKVSQWLPDHLKLLGLFKKMIENMDRGKDEALSEAENLWMARYPNNKSSDEYTKRLANRLAESGELMPAQCEMLAQINELQSYLNRRGFLRR